jgi:predicted transcriptional regulator
VTTVFPFKGTLHDDRVERLPQADRTRLGRNIVKLRTRMSFSQEELAERSAIDARYLQRIEAGEFGGSIAVLKRIIDLCITD